MTKKRILYICSQIQPYLAENEESAICRVLPQVMQERGNEIRTFMPRFGCVNERKNQLHEVIRLSGMNLIINDDDHQLIIKVASITAARIQIYFIDNDDYFTRKATFTDAEGEEFVDNDQRMIFFARGVLETIKKLNWVPDVIHCHGWFSAIAPLYLRQVMKDDPTFASSKIVVSLYGNDFKKPLHSDMKDILASEDITEGDTSLLDNPTYENLYRYVLNYVDGVMAQSPEANKAVLDIAREYNKPVFEYYSPAEEDYFDRFEEFYEKLL